MRSTYPLVEGITRLKPASIVAYDTKPNRILLSPQLLDALRWCYGRYPEIDDPLYGVTLFITAGKSITPEYAIAVARRISQLAAPYAIDKSKGAFEMKRVYKALRSYINAAIRSSVD